MDTFRPRVTQELHRPAITKRAERRIRNHSTPLSAFSSVYSKKEITADQENVRRLKMTWQTNNDDTSGEEKRMRENGRIAEAILLDLIEQQHWLGKHVESAPASEFDDILNQTDIVAFFSPRNKKHTAVGAIDITLSKNKLLRKLKKTRRTLEGETLRELKYVHSDRHRIHGAVKNAVPLVLSIPWGPFDTLKTQWMQGKTKEMREHPLRFLLLEQLLMQLEAMEAFGKATDFERLVNKCNQIQHFLINELKMEELSTDVRDRIIESTHRAELRNALLTTFPEAKPQLEQHGLIMDRFFTQQE